ncbi:NAD-dependent epimerase/dehydratase family protein [Chloroflexota bacterium]
MANSMITGGFGFIGRHLARMLLEKGDNVTIFDVVPGTPFLEDVMDKLTVKIGNLEDLVQVASTVQENKIDNIYHLGAILPPASEQNPSRTFATNVTGTFNVLEAARMFKVKNVLFTSTMVTYQKGDMFVPDDYPQRPETFYGMSKVCGERMGEVYWQKHGVNFRGVRYTIVNGPGRGGIAPGQIVVWTFQAAAMGKPFKAFLEADTEMGTIYVKDAAKLLIDLKDADESKLTRRVYTLPSTMISPQRLIDVAKKHVPGADISYKVNENMMNMVNSLNMARRLDPSLAEQDWNAKLAYDLDETMKDYIKQGKEFRNLLDYPIPEV